MPIELGDKQIKALTEKANELTIEPADTYLLTYRHLKSDISEMEFEDEKDLYLAALMVYGWMPTIPDFHTKDGKVTEALAVLRKLKKETEPYIPSEAEIDSISGFLNKSVVGTSKLLHFLNHTVYPIWDSRIQSFISGTTNPSGMQSAAKYKAYCELILRLKDSTDMNDPIETVSRKLSAGSGVNVSKIRALEFLMFSVRQSEEKSVST